MIDISPTTVLLAKKIIETIVICYGLYLSYKLFSLFSKGRA